MRFKSAKTGGFQVFAVTGVNTVSFGISATPSAKDGLLGFAVEREDKKAGEKYCMPGFKVFRSVIPQPDEDTRVSTWEHPIQSFVWDDFTAKPDQDYTYTFYPLKGRPKNLDRTAKPVSITIHTEPLFSELESDVFFNRGVASSQAYRTRFGNLPPDKQPTEAKKKEALKWLSRDLETALLQFIRETKEGEALRCCFYEFHYAPVLEELKDAIDRGVDVKIIIDAKENGSGKDPFPRNANFDTIKKAKIPKANVIQREAKKNDIQHNKFMVRLTGKKRTPVEVWTGSTNISLGGIHGQTNVGHWLRNRDVAERFLAYWTLLSDDPGARAGDDRAESKTKNDALKKSVEDLFDVPSTLKEIPKGVTPVFSPRSGLTVLDLYFDLVDAASASACITLAFGVSAALKDKLVKHTSESAIAFLLLEKKDEEKSNAKSPFVALRASNNVYSAWGSFLRDPVYQWAKETNARELALNNHVSYIHSKFLLRDPLGKDPIVVTGSANFSNASTNNNDENMLIIRGDHRVADIYFTEFNRLFNHYYFRAVHESTKQTITAAAASLFLAENDEWQAKYAPGKLRAKRLQLYTNMTGFTT